MPESTMDLTSGDILQPSSWLMDVRIEKIPATRPQNSGSKNKCDPQSIVSLQTNQHGFTKARRFQSDGTKRCLCVRWKESGRAIRIRDPYKVSGKASNQEEFK